MKSTVQAHTVCTVRFDKNIQNRMFSIEAEQQGYRHFLNRTLYNCVGGRTTGLQTHSYHCCLL